jgi:hypothetical protein
MGKMAWALVSAEAIKARRSAPLRMALAAPGLLFVLQVLTLLARRQINQADPVLLWRDLLTFGWLLWLSLFAPALIAFEAIWLAGLEHNGRHWKQLFVLPVPRWTVFAVKMVFGGMLLAVSFAVFAASSVGAVLLFSGVRGLHLGGSVPWAEVTFTAARAFGACWLLIVIHTWISVRFPGFAVPAGVAFTAMLLGIFLVNVNREVFGWWYPWTLAINVRPEGLYDGHNTLAPALFGMAAGLVLGPVASWDLGRRVKDV